jgi:periplasmic protein TonB
MGDLAQTTLTPISRDGPSGESLGSKLQGAVALAWPSIASNLGGPASSETLPPEWASRPIFAIDSLTFKRDQSSSAISFVIHAVMITLLLSLALGAHKIIPMPTDTIATPVDFKLYTPPTTLPVARSMGGGGGGGAREVVEASRGHLPMIAKIQIMPPQLSKIDRPKLEIAPSEIMKIPEGNILPNLGVSESPQVVMVSQGRGGGSGFGQGQGGGIGMGHGSGAGPGAGGGYGGGLMSVGGGVAAPEVIHSVEPEFTQEARQANFQGSVSIKLIVDSQGNTQDIRVTRHLGMGLDEKAVEAVRQYKFKPAMYQGHPVSVQIVMDVDFHLH